jgi:DNA-binding NtrC family response regulator
MYEIVDPEDVGAVFQEPVRRAIAAGHTLPEIKELAARVAMDVALRDSGGNAGRAAERLGVSRRAVELRRAGRRDA